MLQLEQQLKFCAKYGINSNELLLLTILLIAQEGDGLEVVKEYFSLQPRIRGATIELLKGLQESGVILKTYKIPAPGSNLDIYNIPINKNLIKDYYKSSFEIGKELWETYPQFAIIGGNTVGIRSISKKFDSPEDFYKYYGKSISWKPETHNHIIELVNWGKEQGVINCTLANFIIDRKWEELEALQNGDVANIDFNAVKLL